MLRELARLTPQGLPVKITDLTISTEGISISGETQSFDGVDTSRKPMPPRHISMRSRCSRPGQEPVARVEFKLAITLKKS